MAISRHTAITRYLGLTALAVFGTISSSGVVAQDTNTGAYIGANVGQTRGYFNNDSLNGPLAAHSFSITSATQDNSSNGYKLFGGYQFNRNVAVEGGYFDLGRFNYALGTAPAGTFIGDTRVRGLNLDLVGMLPVTDRFSVFGRVGAAYAQSRSSYSNSGVLPLNNANTSRNDTNLKIGLGLQYAITQALSVRAELERYRINDPLRNLGRVDMASVGLVYRFGGPVKTAVAQPLASVASPTPLPPPPPPPQPSPPPPPPPPVAAPPAPAPQPAFEPPVRPARQGRY